MLVLGLYTHAVDRRLQAAVFEILGVRTGWTESLNR